MSSPPGPGLPPAKIPTFGTYQLKQGTVIHRVFTVAKNRTAATFNPGIGGPTRFAPIQEQEHGGKRRVIPTLYAGMSFEAAVFETVFRDIAPAPQPRQVREASFINCAHAEITLRRDIDLGPLFNQNLKILGQTRQTMIECHGVPAYGETARWAEAIHNSQSGLHGVAWMSRQQDSELAMLLYGDRLDEADLDIGKTTVLGTGPGRKRMSDLAALFRVDIIP